MVLLRGNGAEPSDLDPQLVTGVPEHMILMSLFECLTGQDPKDLHPIPDRKSTRLNSSHT